MIPRMIPRMKSAEDMPKIIAGHRLGLKLREQAREQAREQSAVQVGYKHEPITLRNMSKLLYPRQP